MGHETLLDHMILHGELAIDLIVMPLIIQGLLKIWIVIGNSISLSDKLASYILQLLRLRCWLSMIPAIHLTVKTQIWHYIASNIMPTSLVRYVNRLNVFTV